MTQVCPVLGDAPAPTLVSMICRPEGVVMGFSVVGASLVEHPSMPPAITAITASAKENVLEREKVRMAYLPGRGCRSGANGLARPRAQCKGLAYHNRGRALRMPPD